MKKKQMKKKTEKIQQRPKLYWLYVTYLVCVGFLFSISCISLLGWINSASVIVNIARPYHPLFLITFMVMSILWIPTLFFLRRKNIFYRKWLIKSLWLLLFIVIILGIEVVLQLIYLVDAPEPLCFDCCDGEPSYPGEILPCG